MADTPFPYIRILTNMPRHPKTLHLARIRSWDQPRAFSYLVHTLLQAAEFAPEGQMSKERAEELAAGAAQAAGIPARESENLLGALEKVRWMDVNASGMYEIHGWLEFFGDAIKERERKRKTPEAPGSFQGGSGEPPSISGKLAGGGNQEKTREREKNTRPTKSQDRPPPSRGDGEMQGATVPVQAPKAGCDPDYDPKKPGGAIPAFRLRQIRFENSPPSEAERALLRAQETAGGADTGGGV